jgi:glycosyltransferase involved in cell wall biosynthesis
MQMPETIDPEITAQAPLDKEQSTQLTVSVIVRAYNRGYIIRDALDSVLRQTYRNFEIVVVDDGSTDRTAEEVGSIGSDRIRYVRHQQNRGVSAAANTGLRVARGDLIAFLDSDDIWKSGYLERMVSFLERHPKVGGVFCDLEAQRNDVLVPSTIACMDVFQRTLHTLPRSTTGEYLFSVRQMFLCLLQEVPIKPIAVLIRREVFNDVGTFDESWRSGEDWELFLRVARHYAWGYVDDQLAVQRVQTDSTFMRFKEQDKISLINLFLHEKAGLRNDLEALRAVNGSIARESCHLAGLYMQTGRRFRSAAVYLKAFKETGEVMMIPRLLAAWMPLHLRNALVRLLRKYSRVRGSLGCSINQEN